MERRNKKNDRRKTAIYKIKTKNKTKRTTPGERKTEREEKRKENFDSKITPTLKWIASYHKKFETTFKQKTKLLG